jgi:hypothetical protein
VKLRCECGHDSTVLNLFKMWVCCESERWYVLLCECAALVHLSVQHGELPNASRVDRCDDVREVRSSRRRNELLELLVHTCCWKCEREQNCLLWC